MAGFLTRLAKDIVITALDPRPGLRPKFKPGIKPPKIMVAPNLGYPRTAAYVKGKIKGGLSNGKVKRIEYSQLIKNIENGCRKLCENGACEEGIVLALEAIKKFKDNKGVFYYWLGMNYLEYSGGFYIQGRKIRADKELKNAENSFRKALNGSSKEKKAEIYYCLGVVYERRKNNGKAIKHYKKAISKKPNFKAAKERLDECLGV